MQKGTIYDDSTVDLPKVLWKSTILVCPLYVEMEGKVYPDDGVSITPEMMYATAARYAIRAPAMLRIMLICSQGKRKLRSDNPCRTLGAATQGWRPRRSATFCVDSRSLSTGIALVTLTACDSLYRGSFLSAEENRKAK